MKSLSLFLVLAFTAMQLRAQTLCDELPPVQVITTEIVDQNCPEQIFVPSVFTPNGDGRNDLFMALGSVVFSEFTLEIYNRWGQPVYRSTFQNQGWDGYLAEGPAPLGDYYWVITYTRKTGQREQAAGQVLLMR